MQGRLLTFRDIDYFSFGTIFDRAKTVYSAIPPKMMDLT